MATLPNALVRIVAWEYKIPTDEVRRWSFTAFRDALATITELRYGVVRAKVDAHNAAAEKFKSSLPR